MYTIIESQEFELYALLRLKSALKLECAGMKHSKGSVYAKVKKDFGFKGNLSISASINSALLEGAADLL